MTVKPNPAAELGRRRWAKVPPAERAKQVPRNGGRPRLYPPCPHYKSKRHNFTKDRCPCGFVRKP
ncbi:MAG: hypothetical protein FWD08_07570 [Alphaproteobacteria bacterium]|nr:hypothetical protein [Alphaproteobacteria bacterium]